MKRSALSLKRRARRRIRRNVLSGAEILEIQQLVRQVIVAEEIARYAVRLVDASRPGRQGGRMRCDRMGQVGRRVARITGADLAERLARSSTGAITCRSPIFRRWRCRAQAPRHSQLLRRVRARHAGHDSRAPARGRACCRRAGCSPMPTTPARELRFLDPAVIARLGDGAGRRTVVGDPVRTASSPTKASASSSPSTASTLPGDDLSTLDWKVYARSDRHYVKQFQEETNVECHLLLDISASMAYRGAAPMSKLAYGSVLAGSLAFLMNRQRDATGLMAFDDTIRLRSPARARRGHLHTLLIGPAAGARNDRTSRGRYSSWRRRSSGAVSWCSSRICSTILSRSSRA